MVGEGEREDDRKGILEEEDKQINTDKITWILYPVTVGVIFTCHAINYEDEATCTVVSAHRKPINLDVIADNG